MNTVIGGKMHILYVAGKYYPEFGGGVVLVKKFAENMHKRGHKVSVITLAKSKKILREIINGVSVIRYPEVIPLRKMLKILEKPIVEGSEVKGILNIKPGENTIILSKIAHLSILGVFNEPFIAPMALLHMLLNKKEKYDIIHATALSTSSPYLGYYIKRIMLKKKRKTKLVVTPLFHFTQRGFLKPYMFELLKNVDGILTSTPFEQIFLQRIGFDNVYFIGEGVKVDEYVLSKEEYKIMIHLKDNLNINEGAVLWIGRLTFLKGFYHLIKAMEKLWKQNYKYKLLIIGPAYTLKNMNEKYYQEIMKIIKLYKKHIYYFGFVNESFKKILLHLSSAVVLPSVIETIPLAFLEAWACKKPVIGSIIPSVCSVIKYQGDGGLLVPFGDINRLAEAINKLLMNEREARKIGENGFRKVLNEYSLTNVIKRLETTYYEVLSK